MDGGLRTTLLDRTIYCWAVVPATTAYPGLAALEPVDVLRIWRPDSGFDIALGLWSPYAGTIVARPIIVLGNEFPSRFHTAPKGARIRIRPRISVMDKVDAAGVKRIVQWCMSDNFRVVRCNIYGEVQTRPQDDYSIGAPAPPVA